MNEWLPPPYSAVECMAGKKESSDATDCWEVGCTEGKLLPRKHQADMVDTMDRFASLRSLAPSLLPIPVNAVVSRVVRMGITR